MEIISFISVFYCLKHNQLSLFHLGGTRLINPECLDHVSCDLYLVGDFE